MRTATIDKKLIEKQFYKRSIPIKCHRALLEVYKEFGSRWFRTREFIDIFDRLFPNHGALFVQEDARLMLHDIKLRGLIFCNEWDPEINPDPKGKEKLSNYWKVNELGIAVLCKLFEVEIQNEDQAAVAKLLLT